eukprot:GHRQ01039526.1.p1 GENE.GHRQ01039526.1~~GHRQ01039526.1.p1  ORF type:complete len:146 (-),score=18.04 GHRQ01039526.1:650-1087(-)
MSASSLWLLLAHVLSWEGCICAAAAAGCCRASSRVQKGTQQQAVHHHNQQQRGSSVDLFSSSHLPARPASGFACCCYSYAPMRTPHMHVSIDLVCSSSEVVPQAVYTSHILWYTPSAAPQTGPALHQARHCLLDDLAVSSSGQWR